MRRFVPKRFRTSWQDAVFALGEIVFMTGLIPALFSSHKPPFVTSAATGLMLLAFCAVQYSYRNWWTLCLTVITAGAWLVLAIQVIV